MTTLNVLLRTRITVVWVALVAATLLSFWLGTDHGLSSTEARTILILVVAFVKVRFVGLYFMELRAAPVVLRSLFEGYCLLVCVVLLGLYLGVS
ncbi:cytochrome C oxidase subunit IV family protein [Pseudonocardia spinosispora]|uniref:cytochrome C oxidase subunit IV family protein n=1 Tax=Pseudonocardia spinosispora TaxID=103441 RepID=UPI000490BEBE|nr:cytochrome C oxidase subunit IV family protein [Pseudonocardia spinosispora]